MAKEPNRRYQTAREVADDLGRWQRGEPIQARPVGIMGRLWKWARRRPTAAALTAVTLLATMAFLPSSLAYSARVTAAYRLAEQNRKDAESRRREADGQRAEADAQRAEADAQRREAESRRAQRRHWSGTCVARCTSRTWDECCKCGNRETPRGPWPC